MSSESGPKFVTDGLILCLDAANPRSYISGATVWNDLTYNVSGGTLTNGPTFSSTNGGSIVFDGIDDYVNILNDGKGSIFETQTFTIFCWVNITTLTNRDSTLWDWSYSAHTDPYYCQHFRVQWFNNEPILFAGWNENGVYNANSNINTAGTNDQSLNYSLPAGVHNIVWTKDGTQNVFYVDGIQICTKTISNTITYYNTPVRIGVSNTGRYFIGNYYSNSFYNRALSNSEVLQNYNATKSRFGL